jgi:tRNA (cmo5U34)-methyltransferase
MTLQDDHPEQSIAQPFNGLLGEEYAMLQLICPAAADMSRHVGMFVRRWNGESRRSGAPLEVVEIGCGTGITTLTLLSARDDLSITAVDIAPAMLAQARNSLASWVAEGRVRLVESDVLLFLGGVTSDSVDLVASGYAFHNFEQDYRRQTIAEVYRVLKPGGVFVNGDRYALDDTLAHLRVIQDEVRHFCATFTKLGRLDLLEQWIVHLFSDESPDHVMPLTPALQSYRDAGFSPVAVHVRALNNAVVSADKPLR